MTSKVSQWNKVSSTTVVSDFFFPRVTLATNQVALVKERENPSVDALSITTWPLSRRAKAKLKVLPTSKSHVDWVQRELTTSESSLPWTNLIQSPNTSSERPLKRMERPSLSHQKFNVLSLQSPFNANAEEWLTRDHVLNKPRRPKQSTESSLLNVPRTPRKRRRKEDDHPSPNLLILLAQTDLITHASFRT